MLAKARPSAARSRRGASARDGPPKILKRCTLPLTLAAPPGGGDHTLDVTVHFQACDDGSCLVPAMLRLQVPVREAPMVGRTLPAPGASPAPAPPVTPGATTR